MKKITQQKIRQAILACCGGFGEATDQQIMRKWTSLTAETQQTYLAAVEPDKKGKKDAGSD